MNLNKYKNNKIILFYLCNFINSLLFTNILRCYNIMKNTFKVNQTNLEDIYSSCTITINNVSYLVNCPDGTQRNLIELNTKFSKINTLLLTDNSVNSLSGYFGFSLSRYEQINGVLISHKNNNLKEKQENLKKCEVIKEDNKVSNKQSLLVIGPEGIKNLIKDSELFFVDNPLYNIYELKGENNLFKLNPCWDTNDILLPSNKYISHIDNSNVIKDENVTIHTFCTNNSLVNKISMSYFFITKERKRPFLIQKAKSLGVSDVKLISKLSKGESVNINNLCITPDDVMGPVPPRDSVLILSINCINDINFFIDNNNFRDIVLNNNKINFKISIIYILIQDHNMLLSSEFDILINLLIKTNKTNFVLLDCQTINNQFLLNEGKYKVSKILNTFSSKKFDVSKIPPNFNNIDKSMIIKIEQFLNKYNIVKALPGMEINILPNTSIINKNLTFDEKSNKKLLDVLNNYSNKICNDVNETTSKISDVYIKNNNLQPSFCILGSNSQKPSIHKNVSSIMLKIDKSYVLIDCGEGTYQQICHLYKYNENSTKELEDILINIRLIFISHKHGDHFLGIINIINKINNARLRNNIYFKKDNHNYITYLIVPVNIKKWLENNLDCYFNQNCSKDFDYKIYYKIIDCEDLNPNRCKVYSDYISNDNFDFNPDIFKSFDVELKSIESVNNKLLQFKNDLFLLNKECNINNLEELNRLQIYLNNIIGINIFAIEVLHCNDAYGCIITNSQYDFSNIDVNNFNNWKISYSGDTRPCNNFTNYCQYSSILFHEATFDDELTKDAVIKMHSTFKEAIDVGKTCWRVVLTHFSPRYSKFVPYKNYFKDRKVLVVLDGLCFSLDDLKDLYNINEDIYNLFSKIDKENIL